MSFALSMKRAYLDRPISTFVDGEEAVMRCDRSCIIHILWSKDAGFGFLSAFCIERRRRMVDDDDNDKEDKARLRWALVGGLNDESRMYRVFIDVGIEHESITSNVFAEDMNEFS